MLDQLLAQSVLGPCSLFDWMFLYFSCFVLFCFVLFCFEAVLEGLLAVLLGPFAFFDIVFIVDLFLGCRIVLVTVDGDTNIAVAVAVAVDVVTVDGYLSFLVVTVGGYGVRSVVGTTNVWVLFLL